MKKVLALFVVLFVVKCAYATCIQDSLSIEQQITQGLYNYLEASKEEKLFIHTDKESCQAGDTIWFKGYLVSAATNLPADLSRYIYVELSDRNNTIHWREKIGLSKSDSVFSGFFPVSENLKQGDYILHAYTYWMQNQDDAFHFTKRIRVVNPYDHKVRCNIELVNEGAERRRVLRISFLNRTGERYENVPFMYKIPGETPKDTTEWANTGYSGISRIVVKDPASDHIWIRSSNSSQWDIEQYLHIPGSRIDFNVQFFPEGGNIIWETKQRIAFKALRRDGLGIKIKGVIQDINGVQIAKLESNGLGMGSVELSLSPDNSYKAIIEGEDGNKKEFLLPLSTSNKACALKLELAGECIKYDILTNGSNDFSTHKLLIHSKGMPMAIFNAEAMRNKTLNLSGSPEGILHFVLLDSLMNPVSERLWFHRKVDREYIDIEYPRSKIKPRNDAKITLNLKGATKQDINGDFSVSVINLGQSRNDLYGGGIDAYLLLTSDLKGYVENPGYYFADSEQYKEQELDNLMLTQGWSRFNVSNAINSGSSNIENPFYMERGQFLSGHVKNFRGKNSVNSQILLIGTNGIVRELRTDSTGHFVENDIWYDIGTRFIVQAISEKGKQNQELKLDDPVFRHFTFKNIIGESLENALFYNRYGKDYIFSDAGERITTLGVVRVYGNGIAKAQQELKKEIEFDARRNFLLGFTGIRSYGAAPGDWTYETINTYYKDEYKFIYANTDKLEKKVDDNPNSYMSSYYSNRYKASEYEMAFYEEKIIHNAIDTNFSYGIMNGERASTIINDHTSPGVDGIIGARVHIPGFQLSMIARKENDVESQGVVLSPVYDFRIYRVDYQWNLQTIVPFAPQQQNVQFYKPSYDVATELLKDVVDEKVTRYWNPNVKFTANGEFEFDFPTAGGDGNQSYTITIEGITDNGTPVHHSFQYSL